MSVRTTERFAIAPLFTKSATVSYPADATRLCRDGRGAPVLPMATSEIRKLYRRATQLQGCGAQRAGRRPGCRVVNIHIRRQPFLHTLQQPVKHDVVHPSVAAELLCNFTFFFPQGMLIFLPLINRTPLLLAALAVKVDARRIVGKNSLGACNFVDAAVGLRIGNIMLERDGQAVRGLDQRRVQVSGEVAVCPVRVRFVDMILPIELQTSLG
jgi:hypothetical protein